MPRTCLRLTLTLALTLFFCASLVMAQTAAELDNLLETETVTTGQAARFVMGAAGVLSPELSGAEAETTAYEEALANRWVKSGQGEAITLQETAFLIMNVFQLKGGLMYSVFHNPRYAYREMVYQRLIPGRTNNTLKISGTKFLQILGRVLNYTGEREEMDSLLRYDSIESGVVN